MKTLEQAQEFARTLTDAGDAEVFIDLFNSQQLGTLHGHFPTFYGDEGPPVVAEVKPFATLDVATLTTADVQALTTEQATALTTTQVPAQKATQAKGK